MIEENLSKPIATPSKLETKSLFRLFDDFDGKWIE